MTPYRPLMTGFALAACVAICTPAFANGGDFFEELAASWGAANADEGVPYFGFVKDPKGKGIAGASVAATTATGSTFVVQADNMGHYRIPGFSKSVDAKLVQLIAARRTAANRAAQIAARAATQAAPAPTIRIVHLPPITTTRSS